MDKEDFKAIALSLVLAPFIATCGWWLVNFLAFVYDGSAAPTWHSFNHAVFGMLA